MAQVNVRNRNKNKLDAEGKPKKPNWEYRFEAARVDGKRKHISKSGFKTKAEALEAGARALVEYNSGTPVARPSELSLNDYLDEWLEKYVVVNLRHKTQLSYKGIVDNHLKPNLGHYRLSSLTTSLLQGFANDLKAKGFSKRHVINILSTLNTALNYAIEPLQYIRFNPMPHVKLPKIERAPKQRIVLSLTDWERIIRRFPFGNKYHVPLMIGYHTGLRISEVFALTWDDIDLEKRTISVNKQLIRYKVDGARTTWCFGKTKTEASVRTIKMGRTLAKLLGRENVRQKENRLLYGEFYSNYSLSRVDDTLQELVRGNNGGVHLVCVNDDGSLVTTDSFKYCSRVIHHELKLEFDFHSLRHTHATILAENGVNIKNLQKRLGHEKAHTTLQTYIHDTDDLSEQTVDIFERAVGGHDR